MDARSCSAPPHSLSLPLSLHLSSLLALLSFSLVCTESRCVRAHESYYYSDVKTPARKSTMIVIIARAKAHLRLSLSFSLFLPASPSRGTRAHGDVRSRTHRLYTCVCVRERFRMKHPSLYYQRTPAGIFTRRYRFSCLCFP